LCPLFPREELNKFPKPYSNLQNRFLPNESRNESEDLILKEMLALYSLLRPKIKKRKRRMLRTVVINLCYLV